MKKVYCIVMLLVLSGCALNPPVSMATTTSGEMPVATQAATEPRVATATQRAEASATPRPLMEPTTSVAASVTPSATPLADTPVLTQSSGGLTVKVFSGPDVEVSVPEYQVSGQAPEGTVLSINDDILVVDQSQTFSAQVSLEDGPNLIEIVASDVEGNAVDFMLTVTYNNQE